MRDCLTAALRKVWQISQVDLEQGVAFSFLGLEIERYLNGDLRIHQTTFTRNLLCNYGFDLMTKPMMHIQVAPSDG